jgi:hypothetical protein
MKSLYLLKRIQSTDILVKSFRVFFFDDFHRVSYFNCPVDLLGGRNMYLLSWDEEQRQQQRYEQYEKPYE